MNTLVLFSADPHSLSMTLALLCLCLSHSFRNQMMMIN